MRRLPVVLAGAPIVLLVATAFALPALVSGERFRPRLQAEASRILGLDVRFEGPIAVKLFPWPRLIPHEVRVLSPDGTALVSAPEVRAWPEPLPLLFGRVRWRRVDLVEPVFTIGQVVARAKECRIEGRNGRYEISPMGMRVFDGLVKGRAHVDMTGAEPALRIECTLERFRVERLLQTLTRERAAEGAMDFSMDLAMGGRNLAACVRTMAGSASLRGRDLELFGSDLDHELARLESSRSLNLVDLGAVFFAGPVGLAVTRGFTYARLFTGPGKSTHIPVLVSDWRVEHGVASARDVAMATPRHRLALQGGLDFVRGEFREVSIAVVNAKGCVLVRQQVRGPFASPVIEKPRVIRTLASPVLGLYHQARRMLPSGPCTPFYAGSVAPPD